MEKKKVKFFERIEITDPEYAQKVYDKETKRFKLKLICAGVSLIGSICGFVLFNGSGMDRGFLMSLMGILWGLGIVATFVAGSLLNFFKIILKFGQAAYNIVPYIFIDMLCFVFGAALGLIVCFVFPVVPCSLALYQSYHNLKDAKDYLALYHYETTVTQPSQE